ncbi:hypothetical protein PO181_05690 [Leuconostoc suionicum]|uniref:hypothetical protein n=1 Tax=Leuconostoc suionicum TaxID=1511761 RepID=UPI00233EF562|nr:hypothetical protein [Leuconostoc suionicum]MDC2816473.1 hypothetical protein [Leuconostoc suionicum]
MEDSNRTSMSVAYIENEIVGMYALSTAQTTTRQTSSVFDNAFGWKSRIQQSPTNWLKSFFC